MQKYFNFDINKPKAIVILLTALGAGAAYAASPEQPVYWKDSSGNFVKSSNGHCVRTIYWTADREIPECEGKQRMVAMPAPEPAPVFVPPPPPPPPPPAPPTEEVMTFPEAALFAFGKADLTPVGKEAIQQYREQARAKLSSAKTITITGHTDNVGPAEFNQKLSEERAQAVADYIISLGADPKKITVVGKGETMPVADNSTSDGRAKNRRVEVDVVGFSK